MTTDSATSAPWPAVTVTIPPPGINATIDAAGIIRHLTAANLQELRDVVRTFIAEEFATTWARSVPTTITDPDGTFQVLIDDEGHAHPITATNPRRRLARRRDRTATTPLPAQPAAANDTSRRQITMVLNPHPRSRTTTAAVMLAAHIAQTEARTVLWDLSGDSGTRTLPSMQPKPASELYDQAHLVAELLPEQITRATRYTHPQPEGFAVLPAPATITADQLGYVADRLGAEHTHLIIDPPRTVDDTWPVLLGMADQIIITTSTDRPDAQTAYDTLDVIEQHGSTELLQRAITLVGIRRDAAPSDLHTITEAFRRNTAAVFHLPDDQTLALPGPVRHDAVSAATTTTWQAITQRLLTMPS